MQVFDFVVFVGVPLLISCILYIKRISLLKVTITLVFLFILLVLLLSFCLY